MRPIMLASDGSPASAEAKREAMELAHTLGAPLLAVSVEHVSIPSYGYYGYADIYTELRKSERDHATALLEEIAADAESRGIECETLVLEGQIVDELCRVAAERHVAMIVLGAHGWGALRRLVFGSVSAGVLQAAPCPVLIARAPDPGVSTWVDERTAATA
jgi:nucleotide-binding universal stress UspA family protein